jgi:hypothetical protein
MDRVVRNRSSTSKMQNSGKGQVLEARQRSAQAAWLKTSFVIATGVLNRHMHSYTAARSLTVIRP